MEEAGRTGNQSATKQEMELAKTRVGNGQRNSRDGNAERARHEETGNETEGTEKSDDGLTTRRENGRLEQNC